MDTFLGIDGGGSKTRALLVDANGRQLHYAESGPSNLNAYDEAVVRQSLLEVLKQCTQTSNTIPTGTCFGLAGAGNRTTRDKLETIVASLNLGKIRITSDATIALEGAFNGGPGILLIAGTGSVCLGKSIDGSIQQCGGYGWLADDAGSAGWMGQRALEIAVQQNDFRHKGHALRDAVFAHLDIKSDEEINAKLYQPVLTRSRIAELSNYVLDLANGGDEAARLIYQEALDGLEKMVRAMAERLSPDTCTLALTGGLITHNPSYRQDIEDRLADFRIQEPESTQLKGAVALARKLKSGS